MKRKLSSILAIGLLSLAAACNTNWVTEAGNILKVALPAALNVIQLISVFTGNPVNQDVLNKVQGDFSAAQQLLTDYSAASGAAQQTIAGQLNAALATTQQDLNTILAATHVVNPQKQAQITALVNFIVTEIAAVESLVPQATTVGAAAPAVKATKLPLSSRQFKKGFNTLISNTNPELAVK